MSGIGAAVLVAALVADRASRPGGCARGTARVRPADGTRGVSTARSSSGSASAPADADLTVVQFSTAFCAPCRATKARLQQLQATRPGLAVVQVDAESHLDEVRELDVRRTPTLFYLDRDGRLIGRSSGAPAAGGADRSGGRPCREPAA